MYKLLGFITGSLLIALPAAWLLDGEQPQSTEQLSQVRTEAKQTALPTSAAQPQTPPAPEPDPLLAANVDLDEPPPVAEETTPADVAEPIAPMPESEPASSISAPEPEPRLAGNVRLGEPTATAVKTAQAQEAALITPIRKPEPKQASVNTEQAQPVIEKNPPETAIAATPAPLDSSPAMDISTHLIWSPFRTRVAAQGFARRLTRLSGVELKVAEAGPGHYRVGFDYADAGQRQSYLQRIKDSSGLTLNTPDPIQVEYKNEQIPDPLPAVEL